MFPLQRVDMRVLVSLLACDSLTGDSNLNVQSQNRHFKGCTLAPPTSQAVLIHSITPR